MIRRITIAFLTAVLLTLTVMTLAACGQSEEETIKNSEVSSSQIETDAPRDPAEDEDQSEAVTFQDPLVERCVREELGKSATATITKKDCEKLNKLTIDSDKT